MIYDLSDLNRIANSLDTLFDGGTWASTDDSDTGTLRWTTLTVSTGHIVYNHGPHTWWVETSRDDTATHQELIQGLLVAFGIDYTTANDTAARVVGPNEHAQTI